ncbi:hypothetical protein Tco_1223299 [Tanacetum coccineum]
MAKDQSIPRRNSVNWHYARDDYMLTTIKVVSRHEDTQLYGAILPNELKNEDIRNSESFKEYYAMVLGAEPPKTKATKTTKLAKKKQPTKTSMDKGLTVLSEVTLTEAEQLKMVIERSKTQTHISYASSLGADEGTGSLPGVPDVPTYDSDDEQISWKSSEEDNDDEVNVSEDDDTENDDDDNDDDVDKDIKILIPDTGIDSIFNLNTEATSLVDVSVTTITEPPFVSATTLPPPPTPFITHMQQTPVPTPTTVPSSPL